MALRQPCQEARGREGAEVRRERQAEARSAESLKKGPGSGKWVKHKKEAHDQGRGRSFLSENVAEIARCFSPRKVTVAGGPG